MIPAYESDDLTYSERACEVDRVVAAQLELLGELAGLACELRVDPDQRQFALE